MNQGLGCVWSARSAKEKNENERECSHSAPEWWRTHNSSADVAVAIGFVRMARKALATRMAAPARDDKLNERFSDIFRVLNNRYRLNSRCENARDTLS
jgi:hypothetical protein